MEDGWDATARGEDLLIVWLVGLPAGCDRQAAARAEAQRQAAAAATCQRARRFRDLLLEVADLAPPVASGRRRRAAAH